MNTNSLYYISKTSFLEFEINAELMKTEIPKVAL